MEEKREAPIGVLANIRMSLSSNLIETYARTHIRIMAFDVLMKKFRRVGETQEREWDGDLNVIFIDEVSHGIFCTTLREKKSRSLDGHIASSSNYRI